VKSKVEYSVSENIHDVQSTGEIKDVPKHQHTKDNE
jgi:hypothetical protein